ncbi:benzoate 1,2-dioxygenase electron transfer component BenC [Acidocella sp.]|uniref:benzoate 1,2-dioxygenase electron transfer component BenC n=1 Tax=Acidocella sp. TaxID=50710 RepID=UPI0026108272|nr:benzoate 1,2-dioxygenase electron transfer component BenC [Acidocella sp.]
MSCKVALNFEDGVTRFITCNETDTVADAAYRAGINIPLDCRDGACGTCKLFCESGSFDGGSYIEDALSDDEAKAGFALACQMKPKTDLVVRVLAPASACKTTITTTKAVVTGVELLSPSTIGLNVTLANALAFLPGQYVNIAVPGAGGQVRAYSFSSKPGDVEAGFLIRNIPNGLMSRWLTTQAKPGDELTLTGPSGSFFLREAKRPLLLLAGGTGLAPMLSMLAEMAGTDPGQPVHLIYGVTHDADLVEVEKIEAYGAKIAGFSWSACVASPESSYPNKGFVTQHIPASALNGGDVDVYLCGPPPMVEAVRTHFHNIGVMPASFYYEKFAPTSAAPGKAA